jgi:hypothetical protein
MIAWRVAQTCRSLACLRLSGSKGRVHLDSNHRDTCATPQADGRRYDGSPLPGIADLEERGLPQPPFTLYPFAAWARCVNISLDKRPAPW